MSVQADRAAQELPSLVAPISRGLNAAVERLSIVEHSCLGLADAVLASDLETALARWGSHPVLMHVGPAQHSTARVRIQSEPPSTACEKQNEHANRHGFEPSSRCSSHQV